MEKIAPDLMEAIERREREHADALARGDSAQVALGDAPIHVQVAYDGPPGALVAAGFPIGSALSDFASGGLSPAQIRALARVPRVRMIDLPVVSTPKLDRSMREILGRDAWAVVVPTGSVTDRGKGAGVIVGVVDSGIDVFHGAFREGNATRILRLWDQTFDYSNYTATGVPVDSLANPITGDQIPRDENGAVLTPARAPVDMHEPADDALRPNLFKNGGQFDTAQIQKALDAHPDGDDLPVSLRDESVTRNGHSLQHGSHVTGIAAGNGAQNDKCTSPFTYIGVAPKADIVFVKTGVGARPNRLSEVAEGVEYIFRVAKKEGKPCVVCISLDTHFAPHNGHAPDSRNFERLLSGGSAKGRAIAVCGGNERQLDLHAAFSIAKGASRKVQVNVISTSLPFLTLFGSYNSGAKLTCIARAPGNPPAGVSPTLRIDTANTDVHAMGTLSHKAIGRQYPTSTSDPDSHFFFQVNDPTALTTGVWEFEIFADNAGQNANIHLWVSQPSFNEVAIIPFAGSVASPQDAGRTDARMRRPAEWIAATIGSRAATPSAITVAAYTAEETPTTLEPNSSQGPAPLNLSAGLYDRTGIGAYDKPDIAAPGVAIDAPRGGARKCWLECNCCVDRYVAESGTSSSAPHIAGVVALMFARNPDLTSDQVKAHLRSTQRPPPPLPPGFPDAKDLWGAGKVDAKAATLASVPRDMAPEVERDRELLPDSEPELVPSLIPASLPERLRDWTRVLGGHPAWNLCAALVSQHFDEVKRLIDTNRRVAAVWQRHGGPAIVRGIAFADRPPDPPIPATLAAAQPVALMTRILRVLARYGGESLRADIARYSPLMQALPGARWSELDRLIDGGRS